MSDTPTEEVEELKACESGPDCLHPICKFCKKPTRTNSQNKTDHPGTLSLRRKGQCYQCVYQTELSEDDLQDGRYNLISEYDLKVMKALHPDMYSWHMARRRRLGITQKDALKMSQRLAFARRKRPTLTELESQKNEEN